LKVCDQGDVSFCIAFFFSPFGIQFAKPAPPTKNFLMLAISRPSSMHEASFKGNNAEISGLKDVDIIFAVSYIDL
jgi:hypothetical protein